jgi:hypothetical protein
MISEEEWNQKLKEHKDKVNEMRMISKTGGLQWLNKRKFTYNQSNWKKDSMKMKTWWRSKEYKKS